MPTFRPGKPRVRLGLSADKTVTGTGSRAVPWDLAEYEDPVVWSALTPTDYVIPKTGLYVVDLCLLIDTATSVGRQISIRVNGTERARTGEVPATANNNAYHVSMQDELVDGDIVTGQFSTTVTAVIGSAFSFLAITRIGPQRWTG